MVTRFTASADPDGRERVVLLREAPARLLRKASAAPVPPDEWLAARPPAAAAALARLLEALEDGLTAPDETPLAAIDGDAVVLHPAFAARLAEGEADALGLPPATRLALELQSRGLVHKPDFRVDTRWVRFGGVPALAAVSGARIRHDGRDWRLPEPAFSTLAAVLAVNGAVDDAAREAALAGLKRAIGDEADGRVAADGTIERLRIAYASGFSLSISASATGFDFDPVLFSRERVEAAEDGAPADEGADSLLPPKLAAGFARRFRQGDGTRRAYLLDDGSLLFLDPRLSRTLGVVRAAQRSGTEARRRFARNPERAIAEALREDGGDPAEAARLFVETQQFSDRVAGIDVWRKPVLPWITPRPNSWLPEKFGLWVGDPPEGARVEIAPEHVAQACAAVDAALHEERATFQVEDHAIPATPQAARALHDIAALLADVEQHGGDAESDDTPPSAAGERFFLQVSDNLDELAFSPIAAAPAPALPPPTMPAALRSSPKPHQQDGFAWLVACWRAGMAGALLADDMGLGKTFQALAFLAWVRAQEAHPRPVLIVAPTGLLANWRTEIERHLAPGTLGEVVGAYGAGLARMRDGTGRDIDLGRSRIDVDAFAHAGVVLTTFETMRDYHLSFARQPFAAIVYDEAQKLKNPASQMTRAAKTLNARFQLAMTGTPVENRLQDLWSILDVIQPGLLGSSRQFETEYPAAARDRLQALHDRLTLPQGDRPPLLLRRMKDDCLPGMPAKIVRLMPAPMPPAQRAAYDRLIARALAVKGTGQRGRMLDVLQHLRGVSLHPRSPDEAGGADGYFEQSARLATLFAILDEVAGKREKVLIFCESLAMQALLAAEIQRRYALPHAVARINGGVAGDARQAAVNTFQSRGAGFDALILSPKAGGVGLTLTAANHVVHLSRWWNPAVEDQATDRAFRIGQERDVTVYLPQAVHPDPALTSASFDLKLDALMDLKRKLSRGLFAPAELDSDADALFDAVVTDEPAPAAEPAHAPALAPEPAPAPRRTLSVRVPPAPPPPPAAPPRPDWPARQAFKAHAARDLAIFEKPIAGRTVSELIVRDPYACAGSRNRGCVVQLLATLVRAAAHVEQITVTSLDADSIDRDRPESTQEQADDLQRKWRFVQAAGPALRHVQLSRRQGREFHDRWIRARTADGAEIMWDLSNGIDGVVLPMKECVVHVSVQ